MTWSLQNVVLDTPATWIWDTNAVIAVIEAGRRELLNRGVILLRQKRELRRVLPVLPSIRTIEYRKKSVDGSLLELSRQGYVVITLDRALTRRIRAYGGSVVNLKLALQTLARRRE